jgi:NAD(P)-dependent dehydrogenase (short-subunit alcohol dehydrogenase family)
MECSAADDGIRGNTVHPGVIANTLRLKATKALTDCLT